MDIEIGRWIVVALGNLLFYGSPVLLVLALLATGLNNTRCMPRDEFERMNRRDSETRTP